MTAKATRHPKTPAQRAQETVDVLTRRQVKIAGQTRVLEGQHKALVAELGIVTKRLDYAKASPDLPAKVVKEPAPPS